jgi:hypothetical protein
MVTLLSAPVNVLPVAVKLTWVALDWTDMLAGKVTAGLLVGLKVTEVPLGAGLFSVNVPVNVSPPPILWGENLKSLGTGDCTVSGATWFTPLREATMLTCLVLATGVAFTVNVALLEFAGTVTFRGTVAVESLALSSSTVKFAGAGPLS